MFISALLVRVCVVCIAPNHELLREPEVAIKEIDFQIGKHDRTKSQVSGKRKNKLRDHLCFSRNTIAILL